MNENVIQSNNNMQNAMEQVNNQQPPRGMPRFHANNMRLPPPHRMNFGPPPPPPPPGYARMQQSRFRAQW